MSSQGAAEQFAHKGRSQGDAAGVTGRSTGMLAEETWRGPQDVFCTTSRTKPVLRPGHLAKGGVPPPVGYPLPVARPRHRASPHQCNVWPLHHQSGRSCPDTLTNLIAVGLRPRSFRAPRTPSTNPARIGWALFSRLAAGWRLPVLLRAGFLSATRRPAEVRSRLDRRPVARRYTPCAARSFPEGHGRLPNQSAWRDRRE